MVTSDLLYLLPELLILGAILVLLVAGAFLGEKSALTVTRLSVVVCVAAALLAWFQVPHLCQAIGRFWLSPGEWCCAEERYLEFHGFLSVSPLLSHIKAGLCLAAAALFVMAYPGVQRGEVTARFEFPILMLFALLGMLLLISSANFLAFYMALELVSLALYILAAIGRDEVASTEAGLKYFILGVFASGLILFGISFVYGYGGTLSLYPRGGDEVAVAIMPLGQTVGLLLVLIGMFFKVAAAPFHMWAPDVYEGSPTIVTAFMAVLAKPVMVIALLIPLAMWREELPREITIWVAVISLFVGGLGGMLQSNLKRLLAYSSINHVGFLLLGLSLEGRGVMPVLFYLVVYMVMNAGLFSFLLMTRNQGVMITRMEELAGLSRSHPFTALLVSVLLFSMAGIPPFLGFLTKFTILEQVMYAGYAVPATVAVISSVLAAYYYLRIIKTMYFDPQADRLDDTVTWPLQAITTLSAAGVAVAPYLAMFLLWFLEGILGGGTG